MVFFTNFETSLLSQQRTFTNINSVFTTRYQWRIEPPKAARGHVTPQTAKSKSMLFIEITCYIICFEIRGTRSSGMLTAVVTATVPEISIL